MIREGRNAAAEVCRIAAQLMAADTGPAYGKKARVARTLGVDAAYLNKLLSNKRASVGLETLRTARAAIGQHAPLDVSTDLSAHVLHLLASMPAAERSLLLKYAAERWPS